MKAIDTLIAEKVMGRHGSKPYSSDIASAWEVVRDLRSRGWNITVYEQATCGCTMHLYAESYYVEAESAPLAICLAALRTCNVYLAGDGDYQSDEEIHDPEAESGPTRAEIDHVQRTVNAATAGMAVPYGAGGCETEEFKLAKETKTRRWRSGKPSKEE